MSKEAALQKLAENPSLPTLPSLAVQIMERASRPNCTIAEIGRIISIDPALCGKILKLVNSALFGLTRTITSIDRALNLLGVNRVRSLVLSFSLPGLRFSKKGGNNLRDYWKMSVTQAIVCREMATRLRWPDPDTEMVGGLLCDIGTLILEQAFPEDNKKLQSYPPEILQSAQIELEEDIFAMNHADVSAFMLSRWRLPESLTNPIRHHHTPAALEDGPRENTDRAYLFFFANRVAQLQFIFGPSKLPAEIVSLARDRFGLNDEELTDFLDTLSQKITDFSKLLDVDFGDLQKFSTLFSNATENLTKLAVETSLDNLRMQKEKNDAQENLKKAEAALLSTEEQLRQAQKMEVVGRLASGVAHDFNNLLTVILGYSDVSLGALPADHKLRKPLAQVKRAAERAADLTRQLLTFSRKQNPIPVTFNLNNVVEGMEKMLKRMIGEHIRLRTDLQTGVLLMKADPSQIEQVIMNLAVNARDAMPKGGTITIETANISATSEEMAKLGDAQPIDHIRMILRDDGSGIDEKTLQRIFEPFFTTKETGTGLGLSTVFTIVKNSHGHVRVLSKVGVGTEFHIYFPRAEGGSAKSLITPESEEIPLGRETILVVEDEKDVREIARDILEMCGYVVLSARNGTEGLEVARAFQGHLDVLLTDAIMPEMGGAELARLLLQISPTTKVIYTSGYTDDFIVRHALQVSGARFLQKPYTPRSLAQLVREVIASPTLAEVPT